MIGYQNDYFAEDGVLRSAIEESAIANNALANTITLLSILRDTPVLLASTPIVFTPDYSELIEPVGILKAIVDHQAFRAGEKGCEVIPEIRAFGDRINELPGKRGLNAFSNTGLDPLLKKSGITTVVLAGAVTSICIDSTGRSAFDRDYKGDRAFRLAPRAELSSNRISTVRISSLFTPQSWITRNWWQNSGLRHELSRQHRTGTTDPIPPT